MLPGSSVTNPPREVGQDGYSLTEQSWPTTRVFFESWGPSQVTFSAISLYLCFSIRGGIIRSLHEVFAIIFPIGRSCYRQDQELVNVKRGTARVAHLPFTGWMRYPGLNISIVRSLVHSANESQSMHAWAVAAASGLRLTFPHRYVTMPTSPWHIADLRKWVKQCSSSSQLCTPPEKKEKKRGADWRC